MFSQVTRPAQQKNFCARHRMKKLSVPSKAAALILLWTAIVGMMYHEIVTLSAVGVLSTPQPNLIISSYDPLPYAILAIVMIFYPLSGFIADVCCGRLKTVVVSLILLLISNFLLLLGVTVFQTIKHQNLHSLVLKQGIVAVILLVFSLLTFVVGLAGYQANFIQFGLDQLFEAPSLNLGLFIHYAIWAFNFAGSLIVLINITVYCVQVKRAIIFPMQVLFSIFFIVLLLVSCWKRKWFHSVPGQTNPYKAVYDVVRYVKRHKFPLRRRSAFAYSDNYIPSRLDFAKERYGGPFTTEQVENVKTLLRILLILFAVGPVFSMDVTSSIFIFPLTSLHMLHHKVHDQEWCTREEVWKVHLAIGSIKNMMSTVILFPAYVWIVFSLLRNKVPKLFKRLGVGIVTCLLGVFSLLIIDVVGHSMSRENVTNQTQCMFRATFELTESRSNENNITRYFNYPSLNMHWSVLIPPNLLLGVGPLIVVATTFEFISAQSPQSMKGLLVGVFFAIRGLFQLLNSIIIIPLSLKQPWASEEMIEHPPVTNCGFVYLLLTCVTGLTGLILFSLAAKKYKYRTRDEGMFRPYVVEEVYDRYLTQEGSKERLLCENTGEE